MIYNTIKIETLFTSTQNLFSNKGSRMEYKFQHFSSLQIETHSISNLREIKEEITEEIIE
jgi:hypothetical protein